MFCSIIYVVPAYKYRFCNKTKNYKSITSNLPRFLPRFSSVGREGVGELCSSVKELGAVELCGRYLRCWEIESFRILFEYNFQTCIMMGSEVFPPFIIWEHRDLVSTAARGSVLSLQHRRSRRCRLSIPVKLFVVKLRETCQRPVWPIGDVWTI
jgi:hypothetical protein